MFDVNEESDEFGDKEAFDGLIARWMRRIVHEIGHGIVSLHHGGKPRDIVIGKQDPYEIEVDGKRLADEPSVVPREYAFAENSGLETDAPLKSQIAVLVAGVAAEDLFFGLTWSEGANRDRAKAEPLAKQLAEESGDDTETLIAKAVDDAKSILTEQEAAMNRLRATAEERLRLEHSQAIMKLHFGPIHILDDDDLRDAFHGKV